jgi:hypothetical protein
MSTNQELSEVENSLIVCLNNFLNLNMNISRELAMDIFSLVGPLREIYVTKFGNSETTIPFLCKKITESV